MTVYDSFSFPPLPPQSEPTLKARLAEARKLRGEVPDWKLAKILAIIQRSAKDFSGRLPDSRIPKIVDIQAAVVMYFGLTIEEMISQKRTAHLNRPRQIGMYLSKQLTPRSLGEIGRLFNRDHASVCYAVQRIEGLIKQDDVLAREIEVLKRMLLP